MNGDVIVKFKAEDMVSPEIKKITDEIYKLETKIKDLKADKKGILKGTVLSDIDNVRKLQVELEKLKEAYKKAQRGSKTAAKDAIKKKEIELEAALTKAINREVIALKRKKDELKRTEAAQRKNIALQEKSIRASNKERRAIDKTISSRRKENAVRRSTMNAVVRHLRQIETLVVAYYTVSRAINITFTKGVQLNRTIENGTIGIAALIAANTEGGNSFERFSAAMDLSHDTILKIKKASVETAATFPQLTQVFQQAIGGALGAGKAMGESVDEIISHTIKLSQRMTNIAASIGMPMEQVNQEIRAIMEGTITKDARIAKMLGITSKDIDEAKKNADGLFKYLNERLKVFDVLETQMSFDKLVARFGDALDTIRMEATKPLFDDLKQELVKVTHTVKENSQEWIQNIHDTYYKVKAFVVYYGEDFSMLADKISEAYGKIKQVINDLVNALEWAVDKLSDFMSASDKTTAKVMGKTIDELEETLKKKKEALKNIDSWTHTLFGTQSEYGLQVDITKLERQIALLKKKRDEEIKSGKDIVNVISKEKEGVSGLVKAYKELNVLSNKKYTSIAEVNDTYTKLVEKYKKYPELMNDISYAVQTSIDNIAHSNIKLQISSKSTIDKIKEIAGEARKVLSATPELDSINEKYKPILDRLNKLMHDSNQKIAKEAESTAELVRKAYEKEIGSVKSKTIKSTKDMHTATLNDWQIYFEKLGKLDYAWDIEKTKLIKKYGYENASNLFGIYKKEFFAKFKKETKKTVKTTKDIWEETFEDISKNIYKSFDDNFFDAITGKAHSLKSVFRDLFKDITTPFAHTISKQWAGQLGTALGIPTPDVSKTATDLGLKLVDGAYKGQVGGTEVAIDKTGQVLQGQSALPTDAIATLSAAKTAYGVSTAGLSASVAAPFSSTGMSLIGHGYTSAGMGTIGFGQGLAHPFTSGLSGSLGGGAAGYGAMAGQAVVGGAIGYGVGKVGDKIFGADTHASTGGAIGGAVGTVIMPGIGTAIGSAIGSAIGGFFGKKKITGTGVMFNSYSSAGNIDAIGYADWKKKSWFSSKHGTKTSPLSASQIKQIDVVFKAYDYIFAQLGEFDKHVSIAAGKYSKDTFKDVLGKSFLSGFTGRDASEIYSIWKDYAEKVGTTISDAITQAFNDYIQNARSFDIWYKNFKGNTIGALKAQAKYAAMDVDVIKSMLGVKNINIDSYLQQYKAALKASPTKDVIEQWNALGAALKKSAELSKTLTDTQKKQALAAYQSNYQRIHLDAVQLSYVSAMTTPVLRQPVNTKPKTEEKIDESNRILMSMLERVEKMANRLDDVFYRGVKITEVPA